MYKIYEDMQVHLLLYKYYYYELSESLVTDRQYDLLERAAKLIAEALYISDECEDCVQNMVGFSKESPYWDRVREMLP